MTEILRNPEPAVWDAYAEKNGGATFSHRYAWGQSLAAAYQDPILRLAARRNPEDRELAGILALMLFAAPGRDLRLVSLPYTDAAGIVADDPTTGAALLAAAFKLAVEQDAVHLELRQAGTPVFEIPHSVSAESWRHTPHTFKTGLRRPLPASSDELWSLLPAKVRNQVRKARTCGCTVAIGGPERLEDFYSLPGFPRIFLPPALLHSFGNGDDSIQAILHEYGVRHVVTRFARARRYAAPFHDKISWECGVGLLERGLAPVPWHEAAASPTWDFGNPILPLHWSNLLHPDPAKNFTVVDRWVEMLEQRVHSMAWVMAPGFASCWSQAAAYHLAKLTAGKGKFTLDLSLLWQVPEFDGTILLKIRCPSNRKWRCQGGQILSVRKDSSGIQVVVVLCLPGKGTVEIEQS
jgi:hypothetical protein